MKRLDHDIRWWRERLERQAGLSVEDLDELEDHLRILIEQKIEQGASEKLAFAEAAEQVGDVPAPAEGWVASPFTPPQAAYQPLTHPVAGRLSGGEIVSSLFHDLRYACRTLAKKPGFALVVVLVLAIAIGINSSMFSLIHGMLWRPPNLENPKEIVVFAAVDSDGRLFDGLSYLDFLEYSQDTSVVSGMALYFPLSVQLQIDGSNGVNSGASAGERVWGHITSGNYFDALGVEPLIGRAFDSSADDGAVETVVMIGHALWQSRFGGDREVVGRQIEINGQMFTVIGVAPPGFRGAHALMTADFWFPLSVARIIAPESTEILDDRKRRNLWAVGRLEKGTTLAQAQARFDDLAVQLSQEYPAANKGIGIKIHPESYARLGMASGSILGLASLVMLASVGLVLLIACVNVANLVLARASARRREIGIRLAMGASRARVVRQLLTESMVLATLGGIAGLGLAVASMRLFASAMTNTSLPIYFDPALDPMVVVYAIVLTATTAVLFGLVPALEVSKSDWGSSLRTDGRSLNEGTGSGGLRRALVVAEIAACLVLLVVASLFARSLQNVVEVDVGFDPEDRLAVSVDLSLNGYDEQQRLDYYRSLKQTVSVLPGVQSASWAMPLPLDTFAANAFLYVEGYDQGDKQGEPIQSLYSSVDADYFETLGTPILMGRPLNDSDREARRPVAVVNEMMAERFWPGQSAVGRHFRIDDPEGERIEVVGIAADGKYRQIAEDPLPYFYLPYEQNLSRALSPTLVVHSSQPRAALADQIRRQSRDLDEAVMLLNIRTLEQHLKGSAFLPATLAAGLVSAFGLLGLVLTVIGLYGLLSYTVSRQTGEIGLRIAMGATRIDVLRMVLARGLRLTAVGLLIGMVVAVGAGRLVGGLLYNVSGIDPLTFVLVPPVLAIVALLACLIPAQRATRIDPMGALRNQ